MDVDFWILYCAPGIGVVAGLLLLLFGRVRRRWLAAGMLAFQILFAVGMYVGLRMVDTRNEENLFFLLLLLYGCGIGSIVITLASLLVCGPETF